jgi:hypothetical protein
MTPPLWACIWLGRSKSDGPVTAVSGQRSRNAHISALEEDTVVPRSLGDGKAAYFVQLWYR